MSWISNFFGLGKGTGRTYSFVGPCYHDIVRLESNGMPRVIDAKKYLGNTYKIPWNCFEIYYCGTKMNDEDYLLISEYTYEYRVTSSQTCQFTLTDCKTNTRLSMELSKWSTVQDVKIALEQMLDKRNLHELIIIKEGSETLPDWYGVRGKVLKYKILSETKPVSIWFYDNKKYKRDILPRKTIGDYIRVYENHGYTFIPIVCNAACVILSEKETFGQYKGRTLRMKFVPRYAKIGTHRYSSMTKCGDILLGRLIYKQTWKIPDYITIAHLEKPSDISVLETKQIMVNDVNDNLMRFEVTSTDTLGVVIKQIQELTQRRIIRCMDARHNILKPDDRVFDSGSLDCTYASEHTVREFFVEFQGKTIKVAMRDGDTLMNLVEKCKANQQTAKVWMNSTEVQSDLRTSKFWEVPDGAKFSIKCEYSIVLIGNGKKTYPMNVSRVCDLETRVKAHGCEVWTEKIKITNEIPDGVDTMYMVNPKELTDILIQRGGGIERKRVKFVDTIGSCLNHGEEVQVNGKTIDPKQRFFSILFLDPEAVFLVKPEGPMVVNFNINNAVYNISTVSSIRTAELAQKIGDYFGIEGCSIGLGKDNEVLWDVLSKTGIVDVATAKVPMVPVVLKKGNGKDETIKFDANGTIGSLHAHLITRGMNSTIFFCEEKLDQNMPIRNLVFDLSAKITAHCPVARTTSGTKLEIKVTPVSLKASGDGTRHVKNEISVTFVCSEKNFMEPFSVVMDVKTSLREINDIVRGRLPAEKEFKLVNPSQARVLSDIVVDGRIIYHVKMDYIISGLHTLKPQTVSLFGDEKVSCIRKKVKNCLKKCDLDCNLSLVGVKRANSYQLLPDDMCLKDIDWGKARKREVVPAITYGFMRTRISHLAIELNDTVEDVKSELEVLFGLDDQIFALSYLSVILKDDMCLYNLPDIQDTPISVHVKEMDVCTVHLSYDGSVESFDALPGCQYEDIEAVACCYFECNDLVIAEDGEPVTGDIDTTKTNFELCKFSQLTDATETRVPESIDLAPPPVVVHEEKTAAEKCIEYTFRHETEVFTECIPVSGTVAQCRQMISERYECVPDAITFLYNGKTLHDDMIWNRLRIKPGVQIIIYIRDLEAILIRSARSLALY